VILIRCAAATSLNALLYVLQTRAVGPVPLAQGHSLRPWSSATQKARHSTLHKPEFSFCGDMARAAPLTAPEASVTLAVRFFKRMRAVDLIRKKRDSGDSPAKKSTSSFPAHAREIPDYQRPHG